MITPLLALVLAQTKLSDAQVTIPPVQGYEERWCPGPALVVDTERTAISVGQRWSTATPCYIHFNLTPPAGVDPVSVSSFVEGFAITLNPTFTGDDEAYIFALAPTFAPSPGPAKIGIRTKNAGVLNCGACAAGVTTDPRIPRMFPANSVPIGFAVIRGGKFLPKADELITRQQVYIGPAAEMAIRYDQGGYWFEVSAVTSAVATATLRATQAETAKVAMETARATATAKSLQEAPSIEARVSALETYFMEMQGRIVNKNQAQQIQDAAQEAQNRVSMQVEGLVMDMQAKAARLDNEIQADMRLVAPPKTPRDVCQFKDWAKDEKYLYRCLPDGTWTRYQYDAKWAGK